MKAFLLFLVFAFITVAGGLIVLLSRKIMHSAAGLLLSLLAIAGLFFLATAEFVAVTQIMVYAGGIIVLLVFGIMLTTRADSEGSGTWNRVSGTFMALALFGTLCYGLKEADFENRLHLIHGSVVHKQMSASAGLEGFALHLFTTHLLTFEVAGILLLVALIGAATIAANAGKEME